MNFNSNRKALNTLECHLNMATMKWIYFAVLVKHLLSGSAADGGGESFVLPSDDDSVGK